MSFYAILDRNLTLGIHIGYTSKKLENCSFDKYFEAVKYIVRHNLIDAIIVELYRSGLYNCTVAKIYNYSFDEFRKITLLL